MRTLFALPLLALTAIVDFFRPEPVISTTQAAALQGRYMDPGVR